ncbi:hypothetical protein ACF3DV_12065 [Chlorogloeopsis fritschii PCC 9212]|nr:hypothetical protein [Chlorogloeopsis fritschii]
MRSLNSKHLQAVRSLNSKHLQATFHLFPTENFQSQFRLGGGKQPLP